MKRTRKYNKKDKYRQAFWTVVGGIVSAALYDIIKTIVLYIIK